jgi:hypothetical protein
MEESAMPRIALTKIAAAFGVAALALTLAATSQAAKGGGGGGHFGGGGGHFGGGGAHFGGGGMHFGGGGMHFGGAHIGGIHLGGGRAAFSHFHVGRSGHIGGAHVSHNARGNFHSHLGSHVTPSTTHALTTGATHAVTAGALVHTAAADPHSGDPHSFAAHRAFAGDPRFRGFWGHGWHPFHHLGWIGPLFWPYAYGDFFYCSLWPWDYCGYDPFWAYGYGDIYEGIFSPDIYDQYVQGPGAPARMAQLTQSMTQSCDDEAAEVTGWPIDQIQAAVQPSDEQRALLDDFGNAIVKASDEVKAHCPTKVSFTPTARLADMHERLQGLAAAVNIVEPPLAKFYGSLSDEQKARFNAIAPPASNGQGAQSEPQDQQAAQNPQAECNASVMAWPADRVDHVVQPNDAQRAKLDALQAAMGQAAGIIKAACPSELPATPPERLAAAGKRLQAMLQAVETVQPALADFYDSLSDDQKARFNTMGRQLFAQNQ